MTKKFKNMMLILLILTPSTYAAFMMSSGIDPLVIHTESIGYRYFGAERWILGVPNIFLQGEVTSFFRLVTFIIANDLTLDIKSRITISSYLYGILTILIVTLLMYIFYRANKSVLMLKIFFIWSVSEVLNPTIFKYDYHTFLSIFCISIIYILSEFEGKFKLNWDVLFLGAISGLIVVEKITYVSLLIVLILNFNRKIQYGSQDVIKFIVSFIISCSTTLIIAYDFQVGVVNEKFILMRTWINSNFGHNFGELFFILSIILLALIIFTIRIINYNPIVTIGNLISIIFACVVYIMRPTNDTKYETLIIVLTIIMITLVKKEDLEAGINLYTRFVIFIILLSYIFFGYQKINVSREFFKAQSEERGRIIWEIYQKIIGSKERTLLVYPDDSWNSGNFGEALLKGYSATPTWYVRTREKNTMNLLYPYFQHYYRGAMYTEPERIEISQFNQFYYTTHKNLPETLSSVEGFEKIDLTEFKCQEWKDTNTEVTYHLCSKKRNEKVKVTLPINLMKYND